MSKSGRIEILYQAKQLVEQTLDLQTQLETGIHNNPIQDVKGDYQKNLTLINRCCDFLLEDYKEIGRAHV